MGSIKYEYGYTPTVTKDDKVASPPKSDSNNKPPKQVGGSHYEMTIQPITYITQNNLSYSVGNVVKYVSRYRQKNGKEDLLKARWYIDYIIETEYNANLSEEEEM